MTWTWPWNTVTQDVLENLRDSWQTRLRDRSSLGPSLLLMDAHMKKVFGADRTTNTGNIQDHDPPYQCGSMAEIAALIPPLQKRARRLARFRAVPSWATPCEIHVTCLDGAEEAVEELDREQLFRDVTAPNAPFVTDVPQDLYRQARMHIKKDAYLTRTGVRQGDNLGPGLFRRSYDAATQEWNEQLDARPIGAGIRALPSTRTSSADFLGSPRSPTAQGGGERLQT